VVHAIKRSRLRRQQVVIFNAPGCRTPKSANWLSVMRTWPVAAKLYGSTVTSGAEQAAIRN